MPLKILRLSLILGMVGLCAWSLGQRLARDLADRYPGDHDWQQVPALKVLLLDPSSGRDSHGSLTATALVDCRLVSPQQPGRAEPIPTGTTVTLDPNGAEGIVVSIDGGQVSQRWPVSALHLEPLARQPEQQDLPIGCFEARDRQPAFRLLGRVYRGSLRVVPDGAQFLHALNVLPLEAWLAGMLAGEMSGSWPEEALKAQAIAGRSYAYACMHHQQGAEWHLSDGGSDPTYRGDQGYPLLIAVAVAETKGRILTLRGDPFKALFHAASGGWTAEIADVDPHAASATQGLPLSEVMVSRADSHCAEGIAMTGREESHGQRSYLVGRSDLRSILQEKLDYPHWINTIEVTRHPSSRRIKQVFLRSLGSGGRDEHLELTLTGEQFRALIGVDRIRSSLWSSDSPVDLRTTGEGQGWRIETRGWGHGVGLSQVSAYAMAMDGQDHEQILEFFYPGAEIGVAW